MFLLVLQALAAFFPVIPVAEHINLFYTLLAVIFVLVITYMFVYNKRH
jgi:uncharacterized membrane protein